MPIIMPLLVLCTAVAGAEIALLSRAAGLFWGARRLGVEVNHISVGFGWTVLVREVRGVPVKIRCIPLGVFVSIPSIRVSSAWRFGEGEDTRRRGRERLLLSLGAMVRLLPALAIAAVVLSALGTRETTYEAGVILDSVPETYVDVQNVEQPNPEWTAGLRAGDKILSVNGKPVTKGWSELAETIVLSTDEVTLGITRNAESLELRYTPAENPMADGLRYPFFEPHMNVMVSSVVPRSPAKEAGLRVGDVICEIDGTPVGDVEAVQERVQESAGRPMTLAVRRAGEQVTIADVRAKPQTMEDGEARYLLGISLEATTGTTRVVHPSPWRIMASMLKPRLPLLQPRSHTRRLVRPRHMSGPIGLLQMIAYRVSLSPRTAFANTVLLSVGLICGLCLGLWPFLDGGRACLGLVQLVCPKKRCLRTAIVLLCLIQLIPVVVGTIQDLIWAHRLG